jgi:hypothetical protein
MRLPLLTVAALFLAPAVAAAAPPVNDNYLASTEINAPGTTLPLDSPFTVDTTEATVQADTFDFNKDGTPLGGGPAELTTCGATSYGKTVWYDIHPNVDGGLLVQAASVPGAPAFQPVLRLYQWDPNTSRITNTVACATPGPLAPNLKKGRSYTLQVGGVGGAGGPLNLDVTFLPDTDGDGLLDVGDQKDQCPTIPGIARDGGCPPTLNVAPSVLYDRVAGGVRITSLVVAKVPKGAKVTATAGGGSQTVKAKKAGTVKLTKLAGRTAKAGASIVLKVTMSRTGSSTYKYGATGAYFKWPVKAAGLGTRVTKCLMVGTSSKFTSCS